MKSCVVIIVGIHLNDFEQLKDTVQPILPPPPSSSKRGHLERQQTVPAPTTSATSSPAATLYSKTPPPQDTMHWFDKETENLFNDGELTGLTKSTTAMKKDQDEVSNRGYKFYDGNRLGYFILSFQKERNRR